MATTNILAQGLGVLATQQNTHHKWLVEETREAKENPVKRWLDPVKFAKIVRLLLLGVTDEQGLKLKCHVWHGMATPQGFQFQGWMFSKYLINQIYWK